MGRYATALVALLLAIALSDAATRRVRNELAACLSLLALAFWWAAGGGAALRHSLLAWSLCGGLLLVPYSLGLLGAADVKVFAGCGAAVNLAGLVPLVIWSLAATGLISLLYLFHRLSWARLQLMAAGDASMLGAPVRPSSLRQRPTIPLTAALGLGVMLTLQGSVPWQL